MSSNENPYPPLPSVLAALGAGRVGGQPLPRLRVDPAGRRARGPLRRPGRRTSRSAPARWACRSSSSRRSRAPATRSCSPGARSRRTRSSAVSTARPPVPVPLDADDRHDLARWRRPSPTAPGWSSCATRTTRPARRCAATSCATFLDAVPDRRARRARRGVHASSCRDPRGARRPRPVPRPAERVRAAHVLQGVRPGRRCASGFAVAHAPVADGAAQDRGAVRREHAGRRRRRSRRSRPRTSCSSGWPSWCPERGPASSAACARRAGSAADSQANFVWLRLGERTGDFAAACERGRCRGARRSTARGCASPSASRRPRTLFLSVAARVRPGRHRRLNAVAVSAARCARRSPRRATASAPAGDDRRGQRLGEEQPARAAPRRPG